MTDAVASIELRELAAPDLDRLFCWESDPAAVALAAFTRADPADRDAFDAHLEWVRACEDNQLLAICVAGDFAGTIGSYGAPGEREITYWIDPARWGRGIVGAALAEFLRIETSRPLLGRVAAHNRASEAALRRAGFAYLGYATDFAPGLGREIVEHIYRLGDRPPARG